MIEEVFLSLLTIFTVSFVSLLWRDAFLLTVSLLIFSIFVLRHFHKKSDFLIFLIGSMMGASAEFVCIYFGAWQYTNTTYLIPLWLPVAWGLASLVISRDTLEIENKKWKHG
jgi:hypothetical protein